MFVFIYHINMLIHAILISNMLSNEFSTTYRAWQQNEKFWKCINKCGNSEMHKQNNKWISQSKNGHVRYLCIYLYLFFINLCLSLLMGSNKNPWIWNIDSKTFYFPFISYAEACCNRRYSIKYNEFCFYPAVIFIGISSFSNFFAEISSAQPLSNCSLHFSSFSTTMGYFSSHSNFGSILLFIFFA